MEMASRFRSLQADARVMKLYRAKVMDAIRNSVKNALTRCAAKHGNDTISLFDDLDWIYDDLGIVEEQLASRFPPDWKVRLPPFLAPGRGAEATHRSRLPISKRITKRSTISSPTSSRMIPTLAPSSASCSTAKTTIE